MEAFLIPGQHLKRVAVSNLISAEAGRFPHESSDSNCVRVNDRLSKYVFRELKRQIPKDRPSFRTIFIHKPGVFL